MRPLGPQDQQLVADPPSPPDSQNAALYAFFSGARRPAADGGGEVWVYDILDHEIGGFAQQQGGGSSITFTSQFGTVNLASLPGISRWFPDSAGALKIDGTQAPLPFQGIAAAVTMMA
jgi:hypothetical protein